MFQIKICGVTTAADARLVAEAGADCIGLNFVTGSPRRLTLAAAREVA
jgi:phosphoribosylanthranilate isomerase